MEMVNEIVFNFDTSQSMLSIKYYVYMVKFFPYLNFEMDIYVIWIMANLISDVAAVFVFSAWDSNKDSFSIHVNLCVEVFIL